LLAGHQVTGIAKAGGSRLAEMDVAKEHRNRAVFVRRENLAFGRKAKGRLEQ
jgi:hypothetical protein